MFKGLFFAFFLIPLQPSHASSGEIGTTPVYCQELLGGRLGHLVLPRQTLEDLGLDGKRAEDSLDGFFPGFKNAPASVRNRLIESLSRPRRNIKEIEALRSRTRDFLSLSPELLTDTSEIILGLHDIVFGNRSKSSMRVPYPSFYYELWHLRPLHYRVNRSAWGFWHKSNRLLKLNSAYPEVTVPVMRLAETIGVLQDLVKLMDHYPSELKGKWLPSIEKVLSHPDVKSFLDRPHFMSVVREFKNPYLFSDNEKNHKADAEALSYRRRYWDGPNVPEDAYNILEQLKGNQEFELAKKEFLELADGKTGIFSKIWEVDRKGAATFAFLRQMPAMVANGLLAEIDFHARLAKSIQEKGYVFAESTPQLGMISVVDAWNPSLKGLAEGGKVQPFSISVDPAHPLMISGPNMGGKTRTAETLGLLVAMNQAGLPVPAAAAKMGLFGNIYTVFPKPSQVIEGEGYFGQMTRQIAEIAKTAKPGDLVILDEVPSGTEYRQQVAVKVVLLEALLEKGATVVVTGHARKAFEIVAARTGVEPYRQTVDADGKPTYHLEKGLAARSHGIELTGRMDFPKRVTDLAKKYYEAIIAHQMSDLPKLEPAPASAPTAEDLEMNPASFPEKLLPVLAKFFADERGESFFVLTRGSAIRHLTNDLSAGREAVEDVQSRKSSEEKRPLTLLQLSEPALKLALTKEFIAARHAGAEGLKPVLEEVVERARGLQPNRWWEHREFELEKNIQAIDALTESLSRLIKLSFGISANGSYAALISAIEEQRNTLEQIRDQLAKLDPKSEDFAKQAAGLFFEAPEAVGETKVDLAGAWEYFAELSKKSVFQLVEPLDQLNGLAMMAIHYGLKAPTFVAEHGRLSIRNARPINMAENGGFFLHGGVAQDISLDPLKPIQVVTGPNSSGKSQRMVVTYLYALMASRGYYVPADIEVSAFDLVYGIFGAENVSGQGESYFKKFLGVYADALKYSGEKSLVIADELQGTDNFELAAIQLAFFHYLRERGIPAFYNTHIRDGLVEASGSLGLDLKQMDVDFDAAGERFKPMFTSSDGVSQNSLGLVLAKKWLTPEQYQRALEVLKELPR